MRTQEDNLDDIRLISAERLAVKWDVTPATVRRWARDSDIPGIKIGKEWRFRVADLRRLVADRPTS